MNKQLLIIGKPHSSKTVFLSQFYSRLRKKKSILTLYKPVEDLTPISKAREALANGEVPSPTPTNKSEEFFLPIRLEDNFIDLICPEYGGEQINSIIETKELGKIWTKAIESSDNWIFFIRLNSINKSVDITTLTLNDEHKEEISENSNVEYSISEQSSLIELLQILLHTKGNNYHLKNDKVRLTVVLTCWDELDIKEKPKKVLQNELPLLLDFIEANWDQNYIKIIGLSALGFPLNSKQNKEKYQFEGPEKFGYIIREDGEESSDITELVQEAL